MHNKALLLLTTILLAINGFTQLKNAGDEKNELLQLSRLLDETAATTTKANDWDEPLRQHLSLDEKNQKIVFRTTVYNEEKKSAKPEDLQWLATHRIPVYEIDTIIENLQDKTLKVVMNNGTYSIATYQIIPGNQYAPAGYNESITIHAKIGEVRNLAKRLNQHINNLQQYRFKELPGTAKAIVQQAVYHYLNVKEYKTPEVQFILDDSKLFIPKCQLCDGSKLAFTKYINESQKEERADWIRFSVDTDFSSTQEKKMAALQKWVEEAVAMYYGHYSAEQVTKMKSKVTEERKKSMNLTNNSKKCASCDGACMMSEE